jgi:hypothetical protein
VTIDGVWIGELDLLTTCTHNWELQVITALPRSSTLYPSLYAKYFPTLLSLQQPIPSNVLTVEILQFPALWSSCHSRPCRTQPNSLNYWAISSQPPLQNSTQLPNFNWTGCPNPFFITLRCGLQRKHSSSIVACVFVSARMGLPSRGSESAVCLFGYCIETVVLVVCFEVFP